MSLKKCFDLNRFFPYQERHPKSWRNFAFLIHSMPIPDEFFISSFAVNSPAHEGRTHNVGLHWLKAFSAADPYNLCRHLVDSLKSNSYAF
jgi:hypothetical protein